MIRTILIVLVVFLGFSMLSNPKSNESNKESKTIDTTKTVVTTENIDEPQVELQNQEVQQGPSQEVLDYYEEVVYRTNVEKNYTPKKWKRDVKIFIKGEKLDYLVDELKRVVYELNELITEIDIKIVDYEFESNYIVFFGGQKEFNKLYPQSIPYTEHSYGLFISNSQGDEFVSGAMYVDFYRVSRKSGEKHLIREELTQSLGLTADSYKYPESIFYEPWTETTEYAEIDKQLIKMVYN